MLHAKKTTTIGNSVLPILQLSLIHRKQSPVRERGLPIGQKSVLHLPLLSILNSTRRAFFFPFDPSVVPALVSQLLVPENKWTSSILKYIFGCIIIIMGGLSWHDLFYIERIQSVQLKKKTHTALRAICFTEMYNLFTITWLTLVTGPRVKHLCLILHSHVCRKKKECSRLGYLTSFLAFPWFHDL